MNKSSKIALGILGAAAIGIIVGLKYTDKGKEISKQLNDKACDWKEQFASLLKKGKNVASEATNGYKKAKDAVA